MVSYNTQIDNTTKKYKIQFETDDYDVFKWVEKICSNTVDTDSLLEVFSTCELVEELVSRKDIETELIESPKTTSFKCNSPAVLLCYRLR